MPETKDRRSMFMSMIWLRMIVVNGEIYESMCGVLAKSVPQWSIPKFLFDIVTSMSLRIQYKVSKLLGDDCYSSKKLQSIIGFKAQRSLKEMNETSF